MALLYSLYTAIASGGKFGIIVVTGARSRVRD